MNLDHVTRSFWWPSRAERSYLTSQGEQRPRAVRRRMPKLGHGARFDLTDAFPCEVEPITDLIECLRLPLVEPNRSRMITRSRSASGANRPSISFGISAWIAAADGSIAVRSGMTSPSSSSPSSLSAADKLVGSRENCHTAST